MCMVLPNFYDFLKGFRCFTRLGRAVDRKLVPFLKLSFALSEKTNNFFLKEIFKNLYKNEKLPYEEVLNLDGRLIFVSPSESFSLFLLNVLIQIRIWNMNANPKLLIPNSLCIRIHNTPASIIFLLQARKAGGWMIWS